MLAYLSDVVEEDEGETEFWIYTPILLRELLDMESAIVSVRNGIKCAKSTISYLLTAHHDGSSEYAVVKNCDIPLDCLPEHDYYIELPESEQSNWTLVEDTVVMNGRYVADIELVLEQDHSIHDVSSEYLGNLLINLQRYVYAVALGPNAKIKSKIPDDIIEKNKILYTADRAASFEMRLESKHLPTSIFFDDPFPEAMECFISMLENAKNNEVISFNLSEKGFSKLKDLVYGMKSKKIAGTIKFVKPTSSSAVEELSTSFSEETIDKVLMEMSVINTENKVFSIPAKLTKVDIDNGTFRLTGTGQIKDTYKGDIVKELQHTIFTVESFGEALLSETIDTELSGHESRLYQLLNWTERSE